MFLINFPCGRWPSLVACMSGEDLMYFAKIAAAAVVVVGVSGAAQAATETFDFTGYQPGVYKSSYSFSSDLGNEVEVTMGTFKSFISDGSAGGGYVGQWTGYGLGVCTEYGGYCCESHYVDGYGGAEYLKFSFDYDVIIESITFKNYGDGTYDLADENKNTILLSAGLDKDVSGTEVGSMFFIGAWGGAGFKVQSITVSHDVSEVPIPAAGFLLLGGLGGLAALKRKRK